MPRPKARPIVVEEGATEEPLTPREAEVVDSLEEAIANLPGGGVDTRVRFSRRNPETHGLEYLGFQMLTEDLEIEETAVKLLQERGITGTHKIVVIFQYPRGVRDRVTGKNSTSRSFDVVVPAPAPEPIKPGADGLTSPTVVSLMIELATLKGKMEGLTAAHPAGTGMAPGSVQDQLSMFERIASVFRSMQPTGEQSGLQLAREALGFINEAKELAPAPAVEDAGMLLAREGIGLVKTIATEHPEAVERFMRGNPGGPPTRGALPAPGPRPGTSAPPAPPPGPPEPPWKVEARKWIPGLIVEAEQGQDPAKIAARALDQLETQYPKVVFDLLADQAEGATFVAWAWAQGVQAFPEIAPHQAWGVKFLEAIQMQLGGDDAIEQPEGGE